MREKRTTELIADFTDGYAAGWKFPIPSAFREALDIKWTKRGNEFMWTQGCSYNFLAGYLLYDCKEAYTLPWGEALKFIKISFQIEESLPAELIGENYNPGEVLLRVYKPNINCIGVSQICTIRCTQEELVSHLRFGNIKKLLL